MKRYCSKEEVINKIQQVDKLKIGDCEVVYSVNYNGEDIYYIDNASISQFKLSGESVNVAFFTIPEEAKILGYIQGEVLNA